MSSDEGGLRRWARRKAEAKSGRGSAAPALEEDAGKPPVQADGHDEIPSAGGDQTAPEQEQPDLPDIESLTQESDFTVFMKEGVSPALRNLALRKLWSSDPLFNVIDEMVEYGEDYTKLGVAAEGIKSAWRPGKGYARDDIAAERQDMAEPDGPAGKSGEDLEAEQHPSASKGDEIAADEDGENEDSISSETDDDSELG